METAEPAVETAAASSRNLPPQVQSLSVLRLSLRRQTSCFCCRDFNRPVCAAGGDAPFGITVNGVEPDNILPEGLAELGEEYLQTMTKAISMKKPGNPEDVAQAMAFLAGDEAGWITG